MDSSAPSRGPGASGIGTRRPWSFSRRSKWQGASGSRIVPLAPSAALNWTSASYAMTAFTGPVFWGSVSLVRDSIVLPPEGPRMSDLGSRHPRTMPSGRSGREGKGSLGGTAEEFEIRKAEEGLGAEPSASFILRLFPLMRNGAASCRKPRRHIVRTIQEKDQTRPCLRALETASVWVRT
jgi:hypothetical protein